MIYTVKTAGRKLRRQRPPECDFVVADLDSVEDQRSKKIGTGLLEILRSW